MAQDVVTKVVGATIRKICDRGVGAIAPYFFEEILVKERLKSVAVRLKLSKARLKTPQNSFFE